MAITRDRSFQRLGRFANLVLVSGGLLCALMLFRSIYYFGLTDGRSLTGPVGMALYYGVPAVLATVLFAALRLEVAKRITLAVLLVSIGVSIIRPTCFWLWLT